MGEWQKDAACREMPLWLFEETGRYGTKGADEKAVEACESCPVVRQCLDDALSFPYQWGYRAGMTAGERETYRRRVRRRRPRLDV